MRHPILAACAVLLIGTGILSAAEPASKKAEPQKNVPKCACTGDAVCKCDKTKKCKCFAPAQNTAKQKTRKAKPQPVKKPVSQSIIKRVTNPVLEQQKKRDQQLIDQGLL